MFKKRLCYLSTFWFLAQAPLAQAAVITPTEMEVVERLFTDNQKTLALLQTSRADLQGGLKYCRASQITLQVAKALVRVSSSVGGLVPAVGSVMQAADPKINGFLDAEAAMHNTSKVLVLKALAETDKVIVECETIATLAKAVMETADDQKLQDLRAEAVKLKDRLAELNRIVEECLATDKAPEESAEQASSEVKAEAAAKEETEPKAETAKAASTEVTPAATTAAAARSSVEG